MEVSINKVNSLLSNNNLHEVENSIANKKKCTIYKDDLPLLGNIIKEEIETSEISVEELLYFIKHNSVEIIEFALNLLDKESPVSLSSGVSVSYSIYLIYLKGKSKAALASYIKRRRIPNSNKFLEKLYMIKLKMNL